MIYQDSLEVDTKPGISLTDLTSGMRRNVSESGIKQGMCNIFLTATTAGLFINENELMLLEDIKKSLRPLADDTRIYHHPSNAASHMRANWFAKDITIPIKDGDIILGQYQSIFLAEFDKIPRKRKLILTVMGE